MNLGDNKSLFCYEHVVKTMFAVTKEAAECLKIAQHSVCCSQKVFARLSEPSLISERGVPTAEPCCGKAANRHYGLMAGLASGLRDERQAVQVDHSLREWLGQRVFSIACGYFPSSRPGARRCNRLTSRRNQKLNNNIRRQQTVMVQLSL